MDLKQQNVKQRIKCVNYIKNKRSYWKGRFDKKALEKQKEYVRQCFSTASYFGETKQSLLDEIKLIDTCIEKWEEFKPFLK